MADLAKVKRNIQRMIDQNAPETDIDAYVASEGTTPEELRSSKVAPQEQALPASDFIKNIPGNAYDMASGFAGGVADNVKKLAQDPMRINPLVAAYQDIGELAKPVMADPQGAYDAAKEGLDKNFGNGTRIRNTIIKHPVDTLMIAAPGLGQLSKGAELASLGKTASALKTAGAIIDPANAVVKPVEFGVNNARAAIAAPPEGQTRISAALLRKTLPQDLSVMDKLGPEAMLLDASPSMTGLARGVSSGVGKGTDDIVNALMNREVGKSGRLQSGAEQIFGKGRDPNAMAAELKSAAQAESKPFYDQARSNVNPLPNSLSDDFLKEVDGLAGKNRETMKTFVADIEDALSSPDPGKQASRLKDVRQFLDDQIVYDTRDAANLSSSDKAAQGVARKARAIVDDILKKQVRGMAEGDAAYAVRMKQSDAFQYGYDSLEGGKSAVWPETFSKDVQKMPKDYVAQGQASRIGNAMGTQANDLSAVRKMIGGDGDFNRAKLAETHGADKVDRGVALVDAEGAMSQNFADIVRNSKTAQSQNAAKLIEKNAPFQVDAGMTTLGMGAKISTKIANALLAKVAGRVSSTTSEALAKALVGDKPTVEALLRDLGKTKNVSLKDKTIVRAILFSAQAEDGQPKP